jgi:hypothetical protein
VDHTYPAGSYTASLKVADGKGGSATAAALHVVSGNNPPLGHLLYALNRSADVPEPPPSFNRAQVVP